MTGKIPVAAYPVGAKDVMAAFFPGKNAQERFASMLEPFLGARRIFFTGCGAAAFYLTLETLKEISPNRDEVVLPAYTAPVMAVAVRKAGLKTALSDISPKDFNLDTGILDNVVSEKTLCIVCAHMFGIPVAGTPALKGRYKDVFIVEDCAQAMGSLIAGLPVGSFGDVSFFSFNRGKNLPTYGGGAVTAASGEIADALAKKVSALEKGTAMQDAAIAWKILLFSVVVNPLVYNALYPLVLLFKSNSVPADFAVKGYLDSQASAGSSLAGRFKDTAAERCNNGMALIYGLRHLKGISAPVIAENIKPAFNRLPVMFKTVESRKKAEAALGRSGIETSNMYKRPMHHIFKLGYPENAFPGASRFARGLLTLPSHPMLDGRSIDKIINVMKEALG